jgi:hypothetical protein
MSVSRDAASAQEPGADLLAAAFLEAGFRHIAVQNTPEYEATTIDQIAAAFVVTSHGAHPVLQQGISPRFGSNTAGVQESASAGAAGWAAATLRAAVRPRPTESLH